MQRSYKPTLHFLLAFVRLPSLVFTSLHTGRVLDRAVCTVCTYPPRLLRICPRYYIPVSIQQFPDLALAEHAVACPCSFCAVHVDYYSTTVLPVLILYDPSTATAGRWGCSSCFYWGFHSPEELSLSASHPLDLILVPQWLPFEGNQMSTTPCHITHTYRYTPPCLTRQKRQKS